MNPNIALGRYVREIQARQRLTPAGVADYLINQLFSPFDQFPQEELWVLVLNARTIITHEVMVSRGTPDASLAHPGTIYREAIRLNACSIVVTHNHPSGDPEPSDADLQITTRLRRAGEILGIPLLDHLIVGAGAWYSLREHEEEWMSGQP